MAYIGALSEVMGRPSPNRAGEFYGNESINRLIVLNGLVLATSVPSFRHVPGTICGFFDGSNRVWSVPSKLLCVGKPAKCELGTSEQMAGAGFVGLYLIEDDERLLLEYGDIDTDILQEDVVSGEREAKKPLISKSTVLRRWDETK